MEDRQWLWCFGDFLQFIFPWKHTKLAFQFGPFIYPHAHHWQHGQKRKMTTSIKMTRTFSNILFGRAPLMKVKSLNPKLVTSNGYDVYERNILPWKRNKFAFQFGPVRHPQAHHWKDGKKPQLQSSRTFSNVYFGKVWPLLKPLNPKLVTSNGYNVPTVDYSLNLHSNLLGYSCLCDFEAKSTHCGKENELSTCVLRALT